MEDNRTGDEFDYLGGVLRSEAATRMNRIGVVVERGMQTFTVQAIRTTVPTYAVETLRELRGALMEQEPGKVIALDIRDIPLADVQVLAPCLGESREARGLVYILTAEQFKCFENVSFDFVYR